jgi:hypothetical protein
MSLRMSYRRYKVGLSSALSAVPRSQVGHAFLPRLCNFYSGLLSQRKRSFPRATLAAGAGGSPYQRRYLFDHDIRTELISLQPGLGDARRSLRIQ